MQYIAKEFLGACYAGLTLVGQEDGGPEWIGTVDQWRQVEARIQAIEKTVEINREWNEILFNY